MVAPHIETNADGDRVLVVEVAGKRATIDGYTIKPTLLERFGVVFLGPEFEGVVPTITIPADVQENRPATPLEGFTDDPAIVKATRDYLDEQDKLAPDWLAIWKAEDEAAKA